MRTSSLSILTLLALLVAGCTGSSVFFLEVGACFDDPANGGAEVSSVPSVACETPHDNEVYFEFDVSNSVYPGEEALTASATEGCLAEFEAFVGTAYADSYLAISWFTPTPEGWEDGDREIVCFVYDLDLKKLTGTMGGSGI